MPTPTMQSRLPTYASAARTACRGALCVFAFIFVVNMAISLFRDAATTERPLIIQILGPVAMASILIAILGGIVWLVGIISISRSTRV